MSSNKQQPVNIISPSDLGNAPYSTVIANNNNNSYTTSVASSFNNLVNVFLPAVQIPGFGATGANITNTLQVQEKIICANAGNTFQTIIDSSNVYIGWIGVTGPTNTNYGPTGYVGNINLSSINGVPVNQFDSAVTFNGAVGINSVATIQNISEKIVGPTGTEPLGSPYICNYSTGGVFFLPASVSSSTFTVKLINVPSITSTTQSYIVTIAYIAVGVANYCNTVTLSTNSTPSNTSATIRYNGGSSAIPNIASGNTVFQQFAVTYYSGTTVVLTSISVFSS
jgi:hypothetical protein